MSTFPVDALDAHIRQRMEKESIPGLSITFSDKSGILFERAYGKMHEDGKPVTTDTIFGVASMSKSFTGACIALLEQEGKLRIDDPVTKFFPEFRIPGTPGDAVLVSHLLTHTSGLPPLPTLLHSIAAHTTPDPGEENELEGIDLIPCATVEDIIRYIREGDYTPLGQPGEYMSYSNDGYAILSSIVDIAAGKPMEEYIQEKLFAPLGMTRSHLGYSKLTTLDNVTQVFTKKPDETVYASDNWSQSPPYRGCGWIISTSGDMHKYYKMLSQGGVLDGKTVLPPAAVRQLLGPHFPLVKKGHYTYGLNKAIMGDDVFFSHTGGLKGVSSAGGFLQDQGIAGACLTNLGGVDAMRILAGAFNLIRGIDADKHIHNNTLCDRKPTDIHMYEGFFGGMESGLTSIANPYKVVVEKGQLTINLPSGEKRFLHFCGETLFMAAKEGENPLRDGLVVRFYVRGGKAWAAHVGSRMLQRI